MALFRLPSSGSAALAPRGLGLLLRAPQMSDFLQWTHLRESSRNYLTPWEPIWPSDDLTRSGFRRRLRRYAEDIASDRSYPFLVFRESDGAMIGGVTLANVRRGIVQAGTIGYWVGATPCPSRLHDGVAAGACCRRCSASSICTASRPPAFPRTRRRSGCWRSAASAARGWRGAISASTASGRTTCCSGCCTKIFAANQAWFHAPWVRRHCPAIRRPACAAVRRAANY